MPKISGKYLRSLPLTPYFSLLTPLSLLLTFLFLSCSKPLEPDYSGRIEFKILASSCTEVWIEVKRGVDLEGGQFQIKRGDSIVFSFRLYGQDTIVVDEGLYPGRFYRYELFYSGRFVSSGQIRTLDTTSHEFEWRIFEFGDPTCGSSSFYDVSVVNDTLIYAVGEIYMRDSTGECDPEFYNLAIWNGREWKLKKIYWRGYLLSLRWILAFSDKDIWFDPIIHWNGSQFEQLPFDASIFLGVTTNKAWGVSSSDFYVVGNGGFIAHWNGVRWERIESGVDVKFTDICGDDRNIWVCGYSYQTGRGVLARIRDGKLTIEYDVYPGDFRWNARLSDTICGVPTSVWFSSGNKLWIETTSGIYYSILFDGFRLKDRLSWAPSYWVGFPERIRGWGENNIFSVGHFGTISHWNGKTWKHYVEFFNENGFLLRSVSVKNNLVAIVGENKIIIGYKK